MFAAAVQVLKDLGVFDVIQMIAIAMGAIFLFRYFTDKG